MSAVSPSQRAWIPFVALCVVWGIPYFFIKLAVQEVPPVAVAFGRVALGAAILLPVAWYQGALGGLRGHAWAVGGFAVTELAAPFTLIAVGERWAASSLAGILIATVPLMVLIVGPLFGVRESLDARRILGVLIGFGGVIALLGIDRVAGPHGWTGVVCLLVAALGYAAGPLIMQRHLTGVSRLGAAAVSMLVAALILLPPAVLLLPPAMPSPVALASILVLGAVCSACGLWLFFWLVAETGAARAAIITYINPAVASLLGVALLHERFGAGAALGLVLILLGSWWATQRPVQQLPASEANA